MVATLSSFRLSLTPTLSRREMEVRKESISLWEMDVGERDVEKQFVSPGEREG